MTTQQTDELANLILPSVDNETANQNVIDLATEEAENIRTLIDMILSPDEGVMSPGVFLPPRERLQRYLLKIDAACGEPYALQMFGRSYLDLAPVEQQTVDAFAVEDRAREMGYLLDPNFFDAYKQGLCPPPVSLPWRELIRIGYAYRKVNAEFRKLWAAEVKKQTQQGWV